MTHQSILRKENNAGGITALYSKAYEITTAILRV